MTIAVAIDGVSYDAAELLATEQRRISQFLAFATPRDINDLSQVYKYTWPVTTGPVVVGTSTGDISAAPGLTQPTDFSTFIQTTYTASGKAVYGVYLRDDSGVLHYLSGGTAANNVQVATPGDNSSMGLIGRMARLPDGTIYQIQPGDLVANSSQTTAPGINPVALGAATGGNIAANTAVVVGRVKFEAESGLGLAQINTRLSDINTVIETLAKVLSVQSDMFGAASGIVR